VILGGGVFRFPPLYGMVRRRVQERLGEYLWAPALAGDLEGYIVPPALGERSGLLGALALAMGVAEDT
ncbi:MAG: fructokinase, partial [Thermoflexus sp.]